MAFKADNYTHHKVMREMDRPYRPYGVLALLGDATSDGRSEALQRLADNEWIEPQEMPEPVDHLPGTNEKLFALMERASKGQKLWHPLDRNARNDSTNYM